MARTINELAEAIYTAVDGSDNREQHELIVTEIMRWLENGETLTGDETVAELAEQWNEYVDEYVMECDAEWNAQNEA